MVLDKYSHLKEELVKCIDSILRIEGITVGICEELREKIENNVFNLVVLGQFKRGKTTLINALLGAEILPTAIVPLTSIATILMYGETLNIKVYFNDGRVTEIESANLPQYVTEKGNPRNEKDVQEVIITYPSPYLKEGVRLIDTPGVGSVYEHNTDVAYQYLPKSDAALFLLSVDQPVSKAELDFLKDVKEYSHRIFFLQNKADYVSSEDLSESISFSKKIIEECMGSEVKVSPLSAKLALEGKLSGIKELLEKSFLPEFEHILNTFLMQEKGEVLLLSVTNNLLRLLSQARLGFELEMKSLLTPLEELKEKIKIFENKKKEVLAEKDDFYLLLDGETKKIIKNVLEEDLKTFRQELIFKVSKDFESSYGERSGMSLKELREHLEELVITEVKQAFAAWRGIEDDKLAKTFEAACRRFITKIDDTVDSLLKFSAELFAVPFDIVKAEAIWSTKSGFYYRFKEQPVGIEIVASSLTLLLPKFIGERIILKKVKEYLQRVIDRHTARVGCDFEERLDKSKLDFRWEMRLRIEATIEGISTAIDKGMTQRTRGEKEANERKSQVLQVLSQFDEIKEKLIQIQQQVSS
ncbi:MAG: dynamin family protein [Nitrospirota bacterium]|nr:dynamin family protein [Nitrospirota bacterium]